MEEPELKQVLHVLDFDFVCIYYIIMYVCIYIYRLFDFCLALRLTSCVYCVPTSLH